MYFYLFYLFILFIYTTCTTYMLLSHFCSNSNFSLVSREQNTKFLKFENLKSATSLIQTSNILDIDQQYFKFWRF